MNDILQHYTEKLKNRFFSYVKKSENCWEWTGSLGTSGYGTINVAGVNRAAHRISFIIENEEIPQGLHILHSCDNRKCVRPDHLRTGTNEENHIEKVGKMRHSYGERHPKARLKEWQVIEIVKSYSPHKVTQSQLAEKYGTTRFNINCILRGKSWKHLNPNPITIDPRFKLSEKQIEEIKSLRGKMTHRDIAKQFHISKTHVTRLLNS
jgi:DNA-binding MarR family transcriptional regulator